MADTQISALATKATPIAADITNILDSAQSNADKKATLETIASPPLSAVYTVGWSTGCATFVAAITTIGSTPATLVIPANINETISAHLTIPSTLHCVFMKGAKIKPSSTAGTGTIVIATSTTGCDGTVSINKGSHLVTGDSTTFLDSNVLVGQFIRFPRTTGAWYRVREVLDATHLVVDEAPTADHAGETFEKNLCDITGTGTPAFDTELTAGDVIKIGTLYYYVCYVTSSSAMTLDKYLTAGGTFTRPYRVIFNGPVSAGRYQWIDPSGDGVVKFGYGAVSEVYPEWWGASGVSTYYFNDIPVSRASWSAFPQGQVVKFARGWYVLYSYTPDHYNMIPANCKWKGTGLSREKDGTVIQLGEAGAVTSDLLFVAPGSGSNTFHSRGLDIEHIHFLGKGYGDNGFCRSTTTLNGTITVTASSNAVEGNGTTFRADVCIGDYIRTVTGVYRRVTEITSDTALTVNDDWDGTETGVTFTIGIPIDGVVIPYQTGGHQGLIRRNSFDDFSGFGIRMLTGSVYASENFINGGNGIFLNTDCEAYANEVALLERGIVCYGSGWICKGNILYGDGSFLVDTDSRCVGIDILNGWHNDGVVIGNRCDNCYNGIQLTYGGATIQGNACHLNSNGLYIGGLMRHYWGSRYNSGFNISGNNFVYNTGYGIYIYATVGVGTVKNNVVTDNTTGAILLSAANLLGGSQFPIIENNVGIDECVTWPTLASSATPDVMIGGKFNTVTGTRTITDLLKGTPGKEVTIYIAHADQTFDVSATNLKGNQGVDFTPAVGDWVKAICLDGTNWLLNWTDNTA